MPKIPMTCIKEVVYAARRYKPGDPLDARGEGDARVLEAIKKAQRVERAAPAALTYNTRMMTASVPVAAPAPVFAAEYVIKVDGAVTVLDAMDYDALRALCERLDVKVHHMARENGMRKALVKSQAAE